MGKVLPQGRISLKIQGTSEVDHWVKALAAKSDDLNSIPGTHTLKGKNQFLQVVPQPHIHTHVHTNTTNFFLRFMGTRAADSINRGNALEFLSPQKPYDPGQGTWVLCFLPIVSSETECAIFPVVFSNFSVLPIFYISLFI